jgi:hypothetical protein
MIGVNRLWIFKFSKSLKKRKRKERNREFKDLEKA